MIKLCSDDCDGCHCHLSAPCNHCVEHEMEKLRIGRSKVAASYLVDCNACALTLIPHFPHGWRDAMRVAGDHLEWRREQVGA